MLHPDYSSQCIAPILGPTFLLSSSLCIESNHYIYQNAGCNAITSRLNLQPTSNYYTGVRDSHIYKVQWLLAMMDENDAHVYPYTCNVDKKHGDILKGSGLKEQSRNLLKCERLHRNSIYLLHTLAALVLLCMTNKRLAGITGDHGSTGCVQYITS